MVVTRQDIVFSPDEETQLADAAAIATSVVKRRRLTTANAPRMAPSMRRRHDQVLREFLDFSGLLQKPEISRKSLRTPGRRALIFEDAFDGGDHALPVPCVGHLFGIGRTGV
jgi:hypothetical protein